MDGRYKALIIAAALVVILVASGDRQLKSSYPIYLIALIVLAAVSVPGWTSRATSKEKSPKEVIPLDELGNREKKLLMFHILAKTEVKGQLDMSEMASEIEVSIYELNDVVKTLSKYNAISLMYPPMHNFPIILKGDPEVSRTVREFIFKTMSLKNPLKEPDMDDFAREVEEYLVALKRKRN